MAMSRPDPTPTQPLVDESSERSPRWLFGLGMLTILALLGAWVYVLFIYDPGLMIDELADRRFPLAAEEVCAAAVDELQELPPAASAATAVERAETVEVSNAILTSMIDDLEPLAPQEPANVRDGVEEWLGDWRTYISDRQAYAANLREDADARFLESRKGLDGRAITRAIDGFAQVNRMPSCATPDDVS
jgi:hypothetical protein